MPGSTGPSTSPSSWCPAARAAWACKRAGLASSWTALRPGRAPRSSAPSEEGEGSGSIGRITSGCPSPTLGKNIAMGYIKDGLHKAGTEVAVLVRGKKRKAVVTKMPFVPTNYWKRS